MSDKTGIEWTDSTWNPIRGCSRVSEGCRNCYAERIAYRFSGPGQPYEGLVRINAAGERVPEWSGKIHFAENHLLDPFYWTTPRRIFVNSMSDLFHPNVTDAMLDTIFAVMALCPNHTFQILTKRPQRMKDYCSDAGAIARIVTKMNMIVHGVGKAVGVITPDDNGLDGFHLYNVWLGVSVENQAAADERIPLLLKTPAAVRFISAEPLLGPINLTAIKWIRIEVREQDYRRFGVPPPSELLSCNNVLQSRPADEFNSAKIGLDWVICGGESGPGSRPMHPDWVRSLRDQCVSSSIPFFFKQWGEFTAEQCPGVDVVLSKLHAGQCVTSGIRGHHTLYTRVGKKTAGALLDGVEWKQFPEVKA